MSIGTFLGSPPHTRGIRRDRAHREGQEGFTPAYAGNTACQTISHGTCTVHPRIRGEYHRTGTYSPRWRGSPPHTRGILLKIRFRHAVRRFTPAYAGNTCGTLPFDNSQWVHPRIRGEYKKERKTLSTTKGSPPHTRGIPRFIDCVESVCRFTPAYAGNTDEHSNARTIKGVHPRIRGEYFIEVILAFLYLGSPPHTRGIREILTKTALQGGFTPAYAGNTAFTRWIGLHQ